jgi:hypothetical protein
LQFNTFSLLGATGAGWDKDEFDDKSGFEFRRNNSGARRISSSTWNVIHSFILYLHSIDPIWLQTSGYRNRQVLLT